MSFRPRFATVALDVDSTVAGIEGIDWLARLRGPDVERQCVELTRRAMDGETTIEAVYGERLRLIAPTAAEINRLGAAYVTATALGCRTAIAQLRRNGVRVLLVSGGLRAALLPLAKSLDVEPADLHAVDIHFAADGSYAGYDTTSPLAMSGGKASILDQAAPPQPILAVGDGATDVDMGRVADMFGAFTGFVRRDAVVREASIEFSNFTEIASFVLDQ